MLQSTELQEKNSTKINVQLISGQKEQGRRSPRWPEVWGAGAMGCRWSVEVGGLVGVYLEMGGLEVVEGDRREVCRRTEEGKAWWVVILGMGRWGCNRWGVPCVRGAVVEFNLGRPSNRTGQNSNSARTLPRQPALNRQEKEKSLWRAHLLPMSGPLSSQWADPPTRLIIKIPFIPFTSAQKDLLRSP